METQEKASILIVDDEPRNLQALEAVLEKLDQNLVKAHSGKEALRQVMKDEFALILLDVQMPEMDGFETAAAIRSREKTRFTPIIFLTAVGKTEGEMLRGYQAGAIDYILKPFAPELLRHKVAVLIELYQKSKQVERQARELRDSEQRLRELNAALERLVHELSAPVLKLYERLIVLPIIGSIETERVRQLTGDMLRAIRTHRAKVVVLDITGVPAVDFNVANDLLHVVEAARLMGAEVLITGISSEIAATLVEVSESLPGVMTFADLQRGVAYAFEMLGLKIAGRRRRPRAPDRS